MKINPLLCLFIAVLTGCGGGGGSTVSDGGGAAAMPSAGASAPAGPLATTAYLKARETVLFEGKTYGLARYVAQLAVDACNGYRDVDYGLPPVLPAEDVMASLDVRVAEEYFGIDKASTTFSGSVATLPDFQRWNRDLAAGSGVYPSVPPDCSQLQLNPVKTGTLWRGGVRYEMRFDTLKAISLGPYQDPFALIADATFFALPRGGSLGQTCRFFDSVETTACMWDLMPDTSYLNWPFLLSGQVPFGPGQVKITEPLEAQQGLVIPDSVFDFPAGFTVVQD